VLVSNAHNRQNNNLSVREKKSCSPNPKEVAEVLWSKTVVLEFYHGRIMRKLYAIIERHA